MKRTTLSLVFFCFIYSGVALGQNLDRVTSSLHLQDENYENFTFDNFNGLLAAGTIYRTSSLISPRSNPTVSKLGLYRHLGPAFMGYVVTDWAIKGTSLEYEPIPLIVGSAVGGVSFMTRKPMIAGRGLGGVSRSLGRLAIPLVLWSAIDSWFSEKSFGFRLDAQGDQAASCLE